MVSGQSFGSSAVSLACIVSMCSVQCFRGGHSLRLAFGSFFYRLILAVVCCCGQTVFFLRCFRLRLDFVQSLFIRNLGQQCWRDVRPCVWPWFLLGCFLSDTLWLESSTTAWLRCLSIIYRDMYI